MAKRKHDDAHRPMQPMQGRGQRGNRPGSPANWGGADLIEHDVGAETAALDGLGDHAMNSVLVVDRLMTTEEVLARLHELQASKPMADPVAREGASPWLS